MTKTATKQKSREQLLARAKKLFAMSETGDYNQAQATIALKALRKLMNENGFTMQDINASEIKERLGAVMGVKKAPLYAVYLASILCDLFECKHYWHSSSKVGGKGMNYSIAPVFVGISPNEEICAYTYDTLIARLTDARLRYRSGNLKGRDLTAARDSYCKGWISGVHQNILHLIPEEHKQEVSTETGLVAVNMLDVYVEEKTTESFKPTDRSDDDPEHLKNGYVAGLDVQVNKGMEQANPREKEAVLIGSLIPFGYGTAKPSERVKINPAATDRTFKKTPSKGTAIGCDYLYLNNEPVMRRYCVHRSYKYKTRKIDIRGLRLLIKQLEPELMSNCPIDERGEGHPNDQAPFCYWTAAMEYAQYLYILEQHGKIDEYIANLPKDIA